jgi:hypothetical protein
LRWDILNAYPITVEWHNNDIEKCDEYSIPGISQAQRDYLNEAKYTDFKTWLILNNMTREEWEKGNNRDLKRILSAIDNSVESVS